MKRTTLEVCDSVIEKLHMAKEDMSKQKRFSNRYEYALKPMLKNIAENNTPYFIAGNYSTFEAMAHIAHASSYRYTCLHNEDYTVCMKAIVAVDSVGVYAFINTEVKEELKDIPKHFDHMPDKGSYSVPEIVEWCEGNDRFGYIIGVSHQFLNTQIVDASLFFGKLAKLLDKDPVDRKLTGEDIERLLV